MRFITVAKTGRFSDNSEIFMVAYAVLLFDYGRFGRASTDVMTDGLLLLYVNHALIGAVAIVVHCRKLLQRFYATHMQG
jgi:hypothetical protein